MGRNRAAKEKYSLTDGEAETEIVQMMNEDVFIFFSTEPTFSARGQTLLFGVAAAEVLAAAAAVLVVVMVWV